MRSEADYFWAYLLGQFQVFPDVIGLWVRYMIMDARTDRAVMAENIFKELAESPLPRMDVATNGPTAIPRKRAEFCAWISAILFWMEPIV